MSSFEKREKSFESKWAHDEELRFKVMARRNKLLGLWAAGEMGKGAAPMLTRARWCRRISRKLATTMSSVKSARTSTRKSASSDHMIRRKMEELLAVAAER